MALLFLCARDYRIGECDLAEMARQFGGLDPETSRGVLPEYQSRKNAIAAEQEQRRLPCFTPRVESRRRRNEICVSGASRC
jgi:hypothetical protein